MEGSNPQLEDGYTRIANELLAAIAKYPFKGAELRLLIVIIRITYGWKRKKQEVSFTDLAFLTSLSSRHVKRVVKRLVLDNVLFKERSASKNILGLNKKYSSWKLWKTPNKCDRTDTSRGDEVTTKKVTCLSQKLVTDASQ